MTVSETEPLVAGPYNGNGVTTVFSYGMTVFAADELLVFLRDSLGVETLQTLTTNYTVAPTGGAFPATGGTITMLVAPPTGTQLIILPDVSRSQDRPFSSQSSITLQEVEDALDKLTAIARQLYERSLRAVTVSAFDPGDVETLIANVTALVALEDEIVALTANLTAIQNVNANLTPINTVATNIAAVATVAAANAAISAVNGSLANVNTVATNVADVNTVAAAIANVNTVAAAIANVNTVAGSITNVNTAATNIATINTVAANIAAILASDPSLYRTTDKIINGNFRLWQRATTSGVSGYGSVDRWAHVFTGGTVTTSQQAFAVGDKLGKNTPRFFLRQAVSGQSAANFASIQQRIEDVASYAGETITVLFWAKRASGAGNLSVRLIQNFGTGGSPSADVNSAAQVVTLTGSWQQFAVTFAVPSITGKTRGTSGNDYLNVVFDTSNGSLALGIQTINVDLWGVHVLTGAHVSGMADNYIEDDLATVTNECLRFYATGSVRFDGYVANGVGQSMRVNYTVAMRVAPTVVRTNIANVSFPTALGAIQNLTAEGFSTYRIANTGPTVGLYEETWTADAEL